MQLLFSVIVPTYNRAHLIGETIQTILNQNYPYFELLIVDDGSKDNTEEVVKSFADNRIRYYKKQNEERGAARNFGLRHATGTYVLFFDSDDWMHVNHLSTLARYINQVPEAYAIIATKYQLKDEKGTIKAGGSQNLKEGWYTLDSLLKGNLFACLYAVNKENSDLTYFEEDRTYATLEDWMFLLQNLQWRNIFLIDEITITIRDHAGRSMADNDKVIEARKKATAWAIEKVALSTANKQVLKAYSSYFCAIHYYIDKNRQLAIKELTDAVKTGGFQPDFAVLLLKIIIGKQWVEKLKR